MPNKSSQPLTINIQEQNLYLAAGLGILVIVCLAVISSIKTKRVTQEATNLAEQSLQSNPSTAILVTTQTITQNKLKNTN